MYPWRRLKDFMKYRVLHVNDTPHQIALGAALGTFVAWTPTIGFQMALAIAAAALFRANKAIAVPIVWVTNPVTAVPLFWFNWKVGVAVLSGAQSKGFGFSPPLPREGALAATANYFLDPPYWIGLFVTLVSFGTELWVGSIIVGTVLGILVYAIVYVAVREYRLRYRPDLLPRMCEAGRKLVDAARQHTFHAKKTQAGVRPCDG